MTDPPDPPIAPIIPIGSARKRVEAQREDELERRVIERWTGPMDAERGWLREGLQRARAEAEADPLLFERVRQHPSGMIGDAVVKDSTT